MHRGPRLLPAEQSEGLNWDWNYWRSARHCVEEYSYRWSQALSTKRIVKEEHWTSNPCSFICCRLTRKAIFRGALFLLCAFQDHCLLRTFSTLFYGVLRSMVVSSVSRVPVLDMFLYDGHLSWIGYVLSQRNSVVLTAFRLHLNGCAHRLVYIRPVAEL